MRSISLALNSKSLSLVVPTVIAVVLLALVHAASTSTTTADALTADETASMFCVPLSYDTLAVANTKPFALELAPTPLVPTYW